MKHKTIHLLSIVFTVLVIGSLVFFSLPSQPVPNPTSTASPTLAASPTPDRFSELVIGDITTVRPATIPVDTKSACVNPVDRVIAYVSDTRLGANVTVSALGDGLETRHYTSLGGGSYTSEVFPLDPAMIIGQSGTFMLRLIIVRCPDGIAIASFDALENPLTVRESSDFESCDRDVTTNDYIFNGMSVSSWVLNYEHYNGEQYFNLFLKETIEGTIFYTRFISEVDTLEPGYNAWILNNGKTVIIYRHRTFVAVTAIDSAELHAICR